MSVLSIPGHRGKATPFQATYEQTLPSRLVEERGIARVLRALHRMAPDEMVRAARGEMGCASCRFTNQPAPPRLIEW